MTGPSAGLSSVLCPQLRLLGTRPGWQTLHQAFVPVLCRPLSPRPSPRRPCPSPRPLVLLPHCPRPSASLSSSLCLAVLVPLPLCPHPSASLSWSLCLSVPVPLPCCPHPSPRCPHPSASLSSSSRPSAVLSSALQLPRSTLDTVHSPSLPHPLSHESSAAAVNRGVTAASAHDRLQRGQTRRGGSHSFSYSSGGIFGDVTPPAPIPRQLLSLGGDSPLHRDLCDQPLTSLRTPERGSTGHVSGRGDRSDAFAVELTGPWWPGTPPNIK